MPSPPPPSPQQQGGQQQGGHPQGGFGGKGPGGFPGEDAPSTPPSPLSPPLPPQIPSPPFAPPPPSPPPPSAPPSVPPPFSPGVCSDSCRDVDGQDLTNDGTCSEAPASVTSLLGTDYKCLYGTDCSDCLARPFCTDCPEACFEHSREQDDGQDSCMQAMWNDDVCDPGCNNHACGHNDCSKTEIIEKCVREQLDATPPISSAPEGADGSTPPVVLSVSLPDNMRLALNEQTNQMEAVFTVDYKMQWQDARLFASPCRAVIPDLLTKKAGLDERRLLGVRPRVVLGDAVGAAALVRSSARVGAAEGHLRDERVEPWWEPQPSRPEGEQCISCATYTATASYRVSQPFSVFGYWTKFPFDSHVISLAARVPSANLYSCPELLKDMQLENPDDWKSILYPNSGEWVLSGGSDAITVAHPADGGVSSCVLEVKIIRQAKVFIVKSLSIGLLLCLGGMLSMYMHPAQHTGDRCAQILVAGLTVMFNLKEDLGLGKVNYLLWIDAHNLMLMILLIVVLVETTTVHYFFQSGSEFLAVNIDRASRQVIIFVVYPLLVIGMICTAFESRAAVGYVLLVAVPVLSVPAIILLIMHAEKSHKQRRVDNLAKLSTARATDEGYKELLTRTFKLFDKNLSNGIEPNEMRVLLEAIHPEVKRKHLTLAMVEVRRIFFSGNTISLEDFLDSLEDIRELVTAAAASRSFYPADVRLPPALKAEERASADEKLAA